MDRRRHLARRTGHAPVSDQRDLETAVLQQTEIGRQLVQLGHAVGTRPLEAHHCNDVSLQLARLERLDQLQLIGKDPRRRFHDAVLGRHGGYLHHATPEIAAHHPQPAFGRERPRHRPQDAFVQARRSPFTPGQSTAFEEGLLGIATEATAHHGKHIFMQQAGREQLAHQQCDTASGMEVVDVRRAIGIDAGQRRHHGGKVGHVLPGQLDARRLGDGRHVQGVVGRTAGGMQRDDGVDQHALVDQLTERREAAALWRQPGNLARGLGGQRIAQWRARVDEGRARQMQAHHFHQHLIGVGGAVKRTGARAVVGLHFRRQQLVAPGLAFGVALAHRRLVLVGQAGWHRTSRYEHGG